MEANQGCSGNHCANGSTVDCGERQGVAGHRAWFERAVQIAGRMVRKNLGKIRARTLTTMPRISASDLRST